VNQLLQLPMLLMVEMMYWVTALDTYLYILQELNCSERIVPKIGLTDGMIYDMHLQAKKRKSV
jgi:hypothetical protein